MTKGDKETALGDCGISNFFLSIYDAILILTYVNISMTFFSPLMKGSFSLTKESSPLQGPHTEWPVPVRVPERVDAGTEHDQHGVGQGGLVHELFDPSLPVNTLWLPFRRRAAQQLRDYLRVGATGETDAVLQDLMETK